MLSQQHFSFIFSPHQAFLGSVIYVLVEDWIWKQKRRKFASAKRRYEKASGWSKRQNPWDGSDDDALAMDTSQWILHLECLWSLCRLVPNPDDIWLNTFSNLVPVHTHMNISCEKKNTWNPFLMDSKAFTKRARHFFIFQLFFFQRQYLSSCEKKVSCISPKWKAPKKNRICKDKKKKSNQILPFGTKLQQLHETRFSSTFTTQTFLQKVYNNSDSVKSSGIEICSLYIKIKISIYTRVSEVPWKRLYVKDVSTQVWQNDCDATRVELTSEMHLNEGWKFKESQNQGET